MHSHQNWRQLNIPSFSSCWLKYQTDHSKKLCFCKIVLKHLKIYLDLNQNVKKMYFTIKSIGICAILIIYPSSLTTTHCAMPFQSLYRERDG